MKKHLLIIASTFISGFLYAQVVDIPDPSFKSYLVSFGVDANKDGKIQTSEAEAVTQLSITQRAIADLTGIEAFTSLKNLDCSGNQLTTLSLTKNTALSILTCKNNTLTSLDISKNTKLAILYCSNNQLTQLDLSNNPLLQKIECDVNKLTSLNVTQNLKLTSIECAGNKLSTLDVTKNVLLAYMSCGINPLIELDVTQNVNLRELNCSNNSQIRFLDVSKDTLLTVLSLTGTSNLGTVCINSSQVKYVVGKWNYGTAASFSTSCGIATGLEDTASPIVQKVLTRITTLDGKEIKPGYQDEGVYIYQYSDGSRQKVFLNER